MYSTYIACSTGLEKGNVHNTLCATVVHCAHVKLLCVFDISMMLQLDWREGAEHA